MIFSIGGTRPGQRRAHALGVEPITAQLFAVADEHGDEFVVALDEQRVGVDIDNLDRGPERTRQRFKLDPQIARSPEARRLVAAIADLRPVFAEPAILERKGVETPLRGPLALLEALLAHGRKGLSIQRYKGLGEMNPEQLWETTLDPEVRSLYQVRIEHADEAGKIFETLMGDVVEPRREFIQDNALKVVNLDV